MEGTYIKSIGYHVPEGRLSNDDILSLVRVQNNDRFSNDDIDYILYGIQRKFEFLGIESRSFWNDDPSNSCLTMAVNSAEKAIAASGIKREEIDCLIFSSVSNPFREPSFAIACANKLNIIDGDFFDINDTCNGFLKSIEIADLYINSGKYQNILIVCSENPYELIDGMNLNFRVSNIEEVDSRFSGMIVGCGSASVIISSSGEERKIQHYIEKKSSNDWDASLLTVPGTCHSVSKYGTDKGFWSDARLISSQIIKEEPQFILDKIDEWGIDVNSISSFILHQLGDNITFALLDKIGASHSKAPINTFNMFGNLATVNIPVNLGMAEDKGYIKRGDTVLLINSACGLSYSAMHINW